MIARDRLLRAAPIAVGLALLALFFAPVLDPRVQLFYRDTGRLYYPVKLFIARELRAGRLPFWDPMTECGVSLLGQVTPALLHPATLLYLVFPFDLAFKLNHLLGPLLAAVGTYRLARRLAAGPWASLAAAIAYAGSGYLLSVTGSNLPFALGAGSVPIAVDAVLGFVETPSIGRLAWAGSAVALIAYAGEPQAMLIAGLLSGAWALALGLPDWRRASRHLALVAACGLLAVTLAAPAVFPAIVELRRSDRAALTERDREAFFNDPRRLAGLLVPRAFDDAPEVVEDTPFAESTYSEYFTEGSAAFADSIIVGAPALLLALAGALAGRRGALLFGGACLLAIASTGTALGIDRVLLALVPLAGFFRFAEKLIAPATLLFALAAALGVESALGGSRRAASRLALIALLVAAAAAACALYVGAHAPDLAGRLAQGGKTHRMLFAETFLRELRAGLFDCAGLSAALAAVAAWRWRRQLPASGLGAACCAAAALASSGGLLYTAPLRFVKGPFDLAERLHARAGPSPGRWRLFVDNRNLPTMAGLPPRVAITVSAAEALFPQFESTSGIEGMSPYFSAGDRTYVRAINAAPETLFNLFGVRFAVEMPRSLTPRGALLRNFHKVGLGYWVREYPVLPRAFVVGRARRVQGVDEGLSLLGDPGFDVRREAIVRGEAAIGIATGEPAPAALERISSDRIVVQARGPGLLVVGEHFDPGWRAEIDGRSAPTAETDLSAIGVVLPASGATVRLRFVPVGLWPGLALAIGGAAALVAVGAARRKWARVE